MFDKYNKVESYQYSIDLSKPIDFFCNLINEIGKSINSTYKLKELFNEEFLTEEVQFRFNKEEASEEVIETITDLASYISNFFNNNIFDLIDISKTDVFLIYKTERILFSYANTVKRAITIKKSLTNLIKEEKIFDIITSHIKDDKLKQIITNIKSLNYDQYFNNVIDVKDQISIEIPYIPLDYFNVDKIKFDLIDKQDIIADHHQLLKNFEIKVEKEIDMSIVQASDVDKDLSIGIKYGNTVFPIKSFDWKALIKEDSLKDYYWLLFKNVFKKDATRTIEHSNQLLSDFKLDMQNPKLNKLLSFLKNNHYILKNELQDFEEYEKYFEEVNKIKGLKHIANFEFYVSDFKGKTALGIYSTEKIGTTYNLLHWIRYQEESSKLDYYRNVEKPLTKDKDIIYSLKPQLAFYFITNYFEDFVEEIIKGATTEYLKNFELFVHSNSIGEIDFLIKSDSKLCFIEAKTKLTNEYIEGFIAKSSKLLESLNENNISAEFYLISAYSDNSCERKRFFINRDEKPDYNSKREDLNTIPYFFTVPIPQHNDAILTCIAEPEFDKLKQIIEDICKK